MATNWYRPSKPIGHITHSYVSPLSSDSSQDQRHTNWYKARNQRHVNHINWYKISKPIGIVHSYASSSRSRRGNYNPNQYKPLASIGQLSTPKTGQIYQQIQQRAPVLQTQTSQMPSLPNDSRADMAKQMEGLLSTGSPYLVAARARAIEEANRRGLLNTSIAAGAGEAAAIRAAFPIAQQNAAYYQKGALQQQATASQQLGFQTQGAISGWLDYGKNVYQAAQTAYEAALKSALSAQEAKQQADLAAQKAIQEERLSAQEARQRQKLEALSQAAATRRTQIEAETNLAIKNLDITSNEKANAAQDIRAAGNRFSISVENINRDPNVSEEDKAAAIESQFNIYKMEIDTIMRTYGGHIDLSDYTF